MPCYLKPTWVMFQKKVQWLFLGRACWRIALTFDLKLESEARAFAVGHVSLECHVCSGVPPSNHSCNMVLPLLTTVITTPSPALHHLSPGLLQNLASWSPYGLFSTQQLGNLMQPKSSMSLLCSNASLSPHITQRKGNSYKLSMYNPSLTSSPNQRETHRKGSLSRIGLVVKAFPSICPSWGQPLAFLASFVLRSHHVLEQWYHFHEPCSPLLTLLQSHWCPCCFSNSPGQLTLAVLTAWHALPSNGCMAPSPFRILPKYSFWGRSSLTILFTITTPSAHPPSTLELFFSTTFIMT